MSTSPGGPGWWRGADGRWYPPHPPAPPPQHPAGPPPQPPWTGAQHPAALPPTPGFGQPPAGPPPHRNPPPAYRAAPPPPPRSGSGATIAIVAGAALVVVVLIGIGLSWAVSGLRDAAGTAGAASGDGCTAVATADVDAVLGGSYEIVQLDGVAGLAASLLDGRVLPDAAVTCWATDPSGRQARIARQQGGDARQRFATERSTAMGTTEDRGGGLSVSSAGYFNKDVSVGDEAFCTSGDVLGFAGVLVRRGDVLVYVSTTAAGQGAATAPDFELPAGGSSPNAGITLGTDDTNCDLAVRLAAKVL